MSKSSKQPLRFGFHRPSPDARHTSFRLTGVNLYLFLTTALLLVAAGAWLLVKYTPFTSWVTGHEGYEKKEVVQFRNRLAKMQNSLDAQNTYIKTLKQRLEGEDIEYPIGDSLIDENPKMTSKSVDRIALDDSLRYRVQRSNISLPVRSPLILNVADKGNLEDEFLIPPITGVVRKSFSLAEKHYGVDIIAPENSAVKCVLSGLVIESDWTLTGGNTLIVQHGHHLISVYKHNSALLKKKGEKVKTGEAIAIIGDTGLHSDGPHVHFELWYNGESVDPEAYIDLTRG